jgi:hypothetical protein
MATAGRAALPQWTTTMPASPVPPSAPDFSILGLAPHDLLGLTVIAAVISTVGAILGVLLKDFLFARSLERWKRRESIEQVYARYQAPLLLAARELAFRLAEIVKHYPTVYLRSIVFDTAPDRLLHNSIADAYFQRYKLTSSLYRFAALLSWMELYRLETSHLGFGRGRSPRRLESAMERVREDLADGQLNIADDAAQWRDGMLFREELRALGECLHTVDGTGRTVIGYGSFCEKLRSCVRGDAFSTSVTALSNFLVDLEDSGRDFRRTRLRRLFVHVVELMRTLDRKSVEPWLDKRRAGVVGALAAERAAGLDGLPRR